MYVNDKVLLLGQDVPEEYDKKLKEIFQVPIIRLTIAGTSLISVFVTGTEDKLIVPDIIFDEELELLKDLNVKVINTKHTCLGNNIVFGKDKMLVNEEISDAQTKSLGEIFGMQAKRVKLSNIKTIGSILVIGKKRGLVGNDITDDDFELLQDEIGIQLTPTSINMGSPYIKSGVVANKNGFAIGSNSGGPEIVTAEEGLGFLDDEE